MIRIRKRTYKLVRLYGKFSKQTENYNGALVGAMDRVWRQVFTSHLKLFQLL